MLLALAFSAAAGMDSRDIVRVRDFCYGQQYDSALAITSAAIARDSSDPAAIYWQASVIQVLALDSGDSRLADSFYVLADGVIARARSRLRQNPHDAEAHLYVGMAQLNRSSVLAWQQRTLAALLMLFKVTPHLNAALACDPSLTDARLGIGIIEYFKASAGRYVPGLGWFGSKKKAFAMVTAVAEGDGILSPAAQFLLAFLLKEDGKYADAIRHCQELLDRYPDNRTALRLLRDAQYRNGMQSDALATGRLVEQEMLRAFPGNRYALSENWMVCGMTYAELGESDSARANFERVVAWEQYADEVPWLAVYVRDAKRWLNKLRSQPSSLSE